MNKQTVPEMFLHPKPKKEKGIILDGLNNFSGFQIGASLPPSMSSFIRDVGKPFIIDPMVYMFALPPKAVKDSKTGKVRSTLINLAKQYHPLFEKTLGERALSASELLDDPSILPELAKNVLKFQRERLAVGQRNLFNPHFSKYMQFQKNGEDIEHISTAVTPSILIPPFFYFDSSIDPWYKVSLVCAQSGLGCRHPGEKMSPVVFMSPAVLDDPETMNRVLSDYKGLGDDGLFIWINGMEEEKSSLQRLTALTNLISALSSEQTVFKLYGGYFSCMLKSKGLSGFSCSLSSNSSRNIFSYEWRPADDPPPRFYIPHLHRSFKLEEARQILEAHPSLRCACAVCKQAYGDNLDAFVKQMALPEYSQRHFLNVRRRELNLIATGPRAVSEELENTINQLSEKRVNGTAHLARWKSIFEAKEPIAKPSKSVRRRTLPGIPMTS